MKVNKHYLRRKRILFTGGGGAGSEGLNRLLPDKYDVHFADADIESIPYPIASHHWHHIPLASSPNFIAKLMQLCCKLEIDLIIPGVDEELLQISRHRNEIGCDVLLPSEAFVRTHLDKYSSMRSMQNNNLPVAATVLPAGEHGISYPCIIKPRKGRGSRGVAIVNSAEEMNAHILLSKMQAHEFIMQELLVGKEYTVMVLSNKDANLRAVVPVRVDVKKGITVRAEIEDCKPIIDYCVKLHACYAESGYYNVQLIITDYGEIKTFEVNPRISTTACLGYAAGIDFISESMKILSGTDNHLLPFKSGLRLRRSWLNEFIPPSL